MRKHAGLIIIVAGAGVKHVGLDADVGMIVYSALLTIALGVSAPWWGWRMATSGRYREGLAGRLGRVPAALRKAVEGKRVVWLHAVSVGEVLAAGRLVSELGAALGEGWVVVISTTTATGQKVAQERFGAERVFYFPLDFAWVVRRYLRALKPELVVLMESELWPRLLVECERIGVPVAVVNARVSDRSYRRAIRLWQNWRNLFRIWHGMLGRVSLYLAQGDEVARRLRNLTVAQDRIQVVGNLKYDSPLPEANDLVEILKAGIPHSAKLVICGSTLGGEEEVILKQWPRVLTIEPSAMLLLAPRHPDRFDVVAKLISQLGYTSWRASNADADVISHEKVLLLDTIGTLAGAYELASVAFIGGSLFAGNGGHNPLEAARFGVPVVMGESYENFREMIRAMDEEEAVRIVPKGRLGEALIALIHNGREQGERGRLFYLEQAGAAQRSVRALMNLIERGR